MRVGRERAKHTINQLIYFVFIFVVPSVGAVKGLKMPWRPEEKDAVFKHLGKHITLQRVPGKTECMACLKKEPTLHRRSWKDVKNFIHNSIQSMKKKMARDEAGLKDNR